jgi:hypothetical protein
VLKQLHVDLQALLLLAPVKRYLFAQPSVEPLVINQLTIYLLITKIISLFFGFFNKNNIVILDFFEII